MRSLFAVLLVIMPLLFAASPVRAADGYDPVSTGTTELYGDDVVIKVLVEAANLGSSDVEVGEITFAPGSKSSGHRHGSIEIFYVVDGTLDHIVNGESHPLSPGMVGMVHPSDTVTHEVIGDEPVRAVVIWAPGGEVDRLRQVFPERPVE